MDQNTPKIEETKERKKELITPVLLMDKKEGVF